MKKILIISDNHGFTHQLREVIERETPFDLFLHLGDGERSKTEYERMLPPLMASLYLKGNNDFKLPKARNRSKVMCCQESR